MLRLHSIKNMISFSKELNSEQLEVVLHGDGPCLVLAGAGSGKTRIITYRVAYLIENGVQPEHILLVTFTNKAADEMKKRILHLLPGHTTATGRSPISWAGTFHHIAYRILILYAPLLGYKPRFSILDSDDSETILKMCIKEVKVAAEKKFPSAGVINSMISYARNAQISLEEAVELKNVVWLQFLPEITTIADRYVVRKKEANAMDFDDLLVNLLLLLNNEQVCTKYASQFSHILVDEYQDTNKVQDAIIKKFASVHKNVLVVGDDAQSIYSFRAADIQNILQFEKTFPQTKIFKLETNYRSTTEILDVANNVISNNREQFKKHLISFHKTGAKPYLHALVDPQAEAQFIAKKIQSYLQKNTDPREIAVLFRASHHSQLLEMELVKAGIVYDYRGGIRFFERAHVKDILSYLRILNNVADTAAWLRVLLHEEGIGPSGAQKIIAVLRNFTDPQDIKRAGSEVLGGKALGGWNNFVAIWEKILNAPKISPHFLIQTLLESPYKTYLETEYVDSDDRVDDIKQLAVFAEKYTNLEEFLAESSLQESFNLRGQNPSKPESLSATPKIVLSTIHQAKGLEWSVVFIMRLNNGSFPHDRALREPRGVEEERRLFYVAITRAKQDLFLTYPMTGGNFGDMLSTPSMFLDEIDTTLLEDHTLLPRHSTSFSNLNDGDVTYEAEEESFYVGKKPVMKPGSFLKEIEDL